LSPMTDEEIDKLFAALDQAVKPMGYAKFDGYIAKEAKFFVQLAEDMKRMSDRAATRKWLRNVTGDPAEFNLVVKYLPELVFLVRRFAPDLVKSLPHAPGGRPSAATPKLRHQICRQIGELLVNGVPLSTTYKRLGKRHNVSARTIQRIWNDREKE
jgi:hypothetical protein